MKHWYSLLLAGMLALIASSCSKDSSEDSISNLTVEMCCLKPVDVKTVASCVLDDDREVKFVRPVNVSWATRVDTLYRAILYYNNEHDGRADVLSVKRILTLAPVSPEDTARVVKEDPLSLVTAWYARNGKFLNLCLGIKTGAADDDQAHRVSLVADSLAPHRRYYRLCHDQNGIPAYYTVETYISVPVENIPQGDTITLTVPTEKGLLRRDLVK